MDERLYRLLMACRWPLATVLSAWAVAAAAITILRQPIPIALPLDQPLPVRVEGGLQINGIQQPVTITSQKPLAVQGRVGMEKSVQVEVQAKAPLPVEARTPLPVDGQVAVEQISQPIRVAEIGKEINVAINDDEPLAVNGTVAVDQVGGRINVILSNAVKSLSPIPLP